MKLVTSAGRSGPHLIVQNVTRQWAQRGTMTSNPASRRAADAAVPEQLRALRAEFPAWRIWREDACGRVRYVARSRRADLNPHTVVTADLGELRKALEVARPERRFVLFPGSQLTPAGSGLEFTPSRPSMARIYDHLLGGKDNYPADRTAAHKMLRKFPEIGEIAQANRAFLARAVRYVASRQAAQFIDLGAGVPTRPNVHETARELAPDACVVYVDRDPMVLAHARAMLAVDDRIAVVAGDLGDPAAVLASPDLLSLIDFRQPVGVLAVSVLHFLPPAAADALVAAVKDRMVPGSYLVISAGTSTGTDPQLITEVQAAYGDAAGVTGRSEAEILAWFDGLNLARPGLTDVWAWWPDNPPHPGPPPPGPQHPGPPHPGPPPQSRVRFLAGVARKPAPARLHGGQFP
jgi:O-methyltransferase involved in polyketide biosynthesis